ncbi:glycosyltransferase family A protein [Amnibacterium kyonggiense]
MLLTVVIPVRDDAGPLERCLRALEQQRRRADELVVVDNGSSDGSAAVALAHGARIVTVGVRGIPGATAAGFDAARGDVIARLDADSVPPVDWLERIEAAFAADRDLAAVSGAARFYGGSAIVRSLGRLSLTVGYFRLIAALLGHVPLYGSNFAIRSAVWARTARAVLRDRADVHDDLDLSLRLPPGSAVRYDPGLSVGVSARSFVRPGGARGQIRMTATTLAAANRDPGLLRLRLRWYLATGAPSGRSRGPLRGLEEREQIAAQRVWRRLARAVAARVDAEDGAQLLGVPTVQLDGPHVVLADGEEDGDAGGAERGPEVGDAAQ